MYPNELFFKGSHIYAYGVCMAVGIILAFIFMIAAMSKQKFNEEASNKILIIAAGGTLFGIFSAMLFQSTYNFIANPDAGFHLGGMTFIGGLIGGAVCFFGFYCLYVYVIAPHAKIKVLQNNMNASLTDALPLFPIAICIGHAFGRLGCFFGGCCYGHETDSWIGMYCAAPHGHTLDVKVLPTQLFEMTFLIVLAVVMAVLYFKYRFNYNFSVYLIGYGIWRFLIEYVRDDARGELIPGVPLFPSQIWSIVMVLGGIGYIFLQMYVLSKHMKHPEQQRDAAPENLNGKTA